MISEKELFFRIEELKNSMTVIQNLAVRNPDLLILMDDPVILAFFKLIFTPIQTDRITLEVSHDVLGYKLVSRNVDLFNNTTYHYKSPDRVKKLRYKIFYSGDTSHCFYWIPPVDDDFWTVFIATNNPVDFNNLMVLLKLNGGIDKP